VRKVSLCFARMDFFALCDLYDDLNLYVKAGSLSALPSGRLQNQASTLAPLVATHIQGLSGKVAANVGATILRELERTAPTDSVQLHYIRYVVALDELSFREAEERLHQYFDLLVNRPQSSGRQARDFNASRENAQTSSLLAYAVLSLSALHFRCGYLEEGEKAVQEAMRMAQENNDASCVAHCLAWMARYERCRGGGSAHRRLLQRSQDRARRARLGELHRAQSLLAAESTLLEHLESDTTAGPIPPVWHELEEMHRIGAELQNGPVAPSTGRTAHSAAAQIDLLRSRAWDLFGHRPLAGVYAALPLLSPAAEGPLTAVQAHHSSHLLSAEQALTATLRLAEMASADGDYRLAARMCEEARGRFARSSAAPTYAGWSFGECKLRWREASTRGELRRARQLALRLCTLARTAALRVLNASDATARSAHLPSVDAPADRSPLACHLRVFAGTALMSALGRAGEIEAACRVGESLLRENCGHDDGGPEACCVAVGGESVAGQQPALEAEVRFALSTALLYAQQPAVALPHALWALTAAQRSPLHSSLLCRARLHVAEVQLALGATALARCSLDASHTFVLQHGSAYTRALLHWLRARCLIAELLVSAARPFVGAVVSKPTAAAGTTTRCSPAHIPSSYGQSLLSSSVTDVLLLLQRALDGFRQLEAFDREAEVLHQMALHYHATEQPIQRELASEQCLRALEKARIAARLPLRGTSPHFR